MQVKECNFSLVMEFVCFPVKGFDSAAVNEFGLESIVKAFGLVAVVWISSTHSCPEIELAKLRFLSVTESPKYWLRPRLRGTN